MLAFEIAGTALALHVFMCAIALMLSNSEHGMFVTFFITSFFSAILFSFGLILNGLELRVLSIIIYCIAGINYYMALKGLNRWNSY